MRTISDRIGTSTYFGNTTRTWSMAWRTAAFRVRTMLTFLGLGLTLLLLSAVLAWVERRPGAVLVDPVLAILRPRDFTWLIFTVVYAGLLVGVGRLLATPNALLRGVQAYALLMAFRIVTMSLTPLAPPPGMITLADPFAAHVVRAPVLTQDLFFSGHTSTMFLLFLSARDKELKALFLACTSVVALAVLCQHVHYTVDVVAAPAFAYVSFQLAARITPEQ